MFISEVSLKWETRQIHIIQLGCEDDVNWMVLLYNSITFEISVNPHIRTLVWWRRPRIWKLLTCPSMVFTLKAVVRTVVGFISRTNCMGTFTLSLPDNNSVIHHSCFGSILSFNLVIYDKNMWQLTFYINLHYKNFFWLSEGFFCAGKANKSVAMSCVVDAFPVHCLKKRNFIKFTEYSVLVAQGTVAAIAICFFLQQCLYPIATDDWIFTLVHELISWY